MTYSLKILLNLMSNKFGVGSGTPVIAVPLISVVTLAVTRAGAGLEQLSD